MATELPRRLTSNPLPSVDLRSREEIRFRHPGYDAPHDILLYLPRVDRETSTFGVHHRTALVACQIIGNNAFDTGRFSLDKVGTDAVDTPMDGILTETDYYFIIDGGPDPYPIVPSFADWEFPHNHIPDSWPQTTCVTTLPNRCGITNSSLAVEDAHLVPKTEALWYARNGMQMYGEGLRDVKNAENTVCLRSDLHKCFDDRYLVIAPKVDEAESSSTPTPPKYATHILSKKAAELWPRRHNVLVQYLPENSRPYLFARFAWAILLQVKPFLLQGVSLHTVRAGASEDGKVQRKVELLTGYQLQNLYGGGGSKAATPIRKRVGGDGAFDDDDVMESNAYDSSDVEDGKVRNKRRRQDSDESQDDQQYALIELESSLRETLSGEGYSTTSGI